MKAKLSRRAHSAASRRDAPDSMVSTTRSRNSKEHGFDIDPFQKSNQCPRCSTAAVVQRKIALIGRAVFQQVLLKPHPASAGHRLLVRLWPFSHSFLK
jgi:hypothetical protein